MKQAKHQIFNVACLASSVLVVLTLFLWVAALQVSPSEHFLSLADNFHVSVCKGYSGDMPGRLVFFNRTNGPFMGGIISLANPNDPPPVGWTWRWGNYELGRSTRVCNKCAISEQFCYLPGMRFRHIGWSDNPQPIWTLLVSFFYPVLLFSILPVVWFVRRWWARRSKNTVSSG